MRHGKKFNHLGRTAAHRDAMLSNMASSLILNKRISTTVAKAKALRKYVEPLITKAKNDTTHSRRVVFSYLQDKDSVHELFNEIGEKVASRAGGYTRIIKLGSRLGDNAEMAIIELVDYNELLLGESKSEGKKKTRRSRRGSGASASKAAAPKKETAAKAEAAKEEEVKEPKAEKKAEAKTEEKKEAKASAKKEEKPAAKKAEDKPKKEEKKDDASKNEE